jgi:hypothetical protein
MQVLSKSRDLPIIVSCFLLLSSACKKEDKPIPVVVYGEIRIDATVPELVYSNTRQIAFDARRTLYLNGKRQLLLLWTCTEYPSGKLPRIESPGNAYTNVDSLTIGKYNFRLTVRDTLGNQAMSNFAIEVKEDSLQWPPKIIPIPDQVIYLPQNSVTLNGNGIYSVNPLGRSLMFKWNLIQQPAGSSPVLIESLTSSLTNVYRFSEGSYLFGFEVTNELGLKNADTFQVKVMPDTLPGTIKIYENLTWTLLDNGWDYIAFLKIHEPDIFAGRNENNTEIMVWDERKNEWMASNDFGWEGDKGGLTIYNYFEPSDYLGKKTKVWVRFF